MFIVHVHCSLFMFIVHCSHGATLIFDDVFLYSRCLAELVVTRELINQCQHNMPPIPKQPYWIQVLLTFQNSK